jgi:peptidoglycan/LPS O-acetylase OafA/YrhL
MLESVSPSIEPVEPTARARIRHLPALDGLRGAAVLAVLVFHGGYLRGGYLGVDAFFVLSGFLITSLLVHELAATGRVDLRAFWSRRARRLLPALFAVVVGVSAYAALLAAPGQRDALRGDALAALGYVANWRSIVRHQDYWELFTAPSPLAHMWSLAIEEQFYVLWPLLIAGLGLLCRRTGRSALRWLVGGSAVLAVGSSALMAALYEAGSTDRAYMGSDTRAASILLGAALAGWSVLRPAQSTRWTGRRVALEVGGGAALMALAVAWGVVDGQTPAMYRGGFLLCGAGVSLVIAAAAHPHGGPVGWLLSRSILRRVGTVSYGLYLWHWPVYVVLDEARTGLDGPALLSLRLLVSVPVALLSYRLVEQPIRHGQPLVVRARLLRIPVGAPIAAGLCVAAVLAGTLPVGAGATKAADAARELEVLAPASATWTVGASPVPRGDRPLRRLLVLGDSVANSVADGATMRAADRGIGLAVAAVNGCLLDDDIQDLQLFTKDGLVPVQRTELCMPVWNRAAEAFDPDAIVLVYGTAGGIQHFQLDGAWVDACSAEFRSWYVAAMTAEVEVLTRRGATVHLTLLPHVSPYWLPADGDHRMDCMNDITRDLARRTGAELLDLAAFVCPQGLCRTTSGAEPLRADGIHFGRPLDNYGPPYGGQGSLEVGTWLVDTVAPAPADRLDQLTATAPTSTGRAASALTTSGPSASVSTTAPPSPTSSSATDQDGPGGWLPGFSSTVPGLPTLVPAGP